MPNNPLPDEPTELMEQLQPKTASSPPAQQSAANPPPAPMVQRTPAAHPNPAPSGANHQAVVNPGVEETNDREDSLTIKFAIGKLNDYIQWFLTVLEAILFIRFVLKMFGADPGNYFANFIFTLTQVLLVPFYNIIPQVSLHANQAFEFSTLFAMLIYFLVFLGLKRFLNILVTNPGETE